MTFDQFNEQTISTPFLFYLSMGSTPPGCIPFAIHPYVVYPINKLQIAGEYPKRVQGCNNIVKDTEQTFFSLKINIFLSYNTIIS